jgi:transcriptional regulator with XRE-family HTH domain
MILKIRLKEILEERSMTQKQLSEIAQLRPNVISELCNNVRESINRTHLGKIAKALNIKDLNELLYFEEQ